MNDPADPDAAPHPAAAFPTRRRVLRSARGLGLAAAGIVAFGAPSTEAGGARPVAPAEPVPDAEGGFGRPPSAEMLRRQLRRSAGPMGSEARVLPGVAAGPEPASAAGERLRPSGEPVDATPLARRGWAVPRATGRG